MARNFNNIQHERLRKKIDIAINMLHDELTDCYYNYWKQEESKAFFAFDVLNTAKKSKKQFDLLHGLLFHIYTILFHKVNKLEPEQYADDEYDTVFDGEGLPIGTKSAESKQWIIDTANQYGVNPAAIKTHLINWVQTELGYSIDLD